MEDEFLQQELFVIDTLETLRIIADPLHGQLFELLIEKPVTVRQIADKLGLSPNMLYYHINQMERAGLIKVVETRLQGNLLEKYYRTVAKALDIDPSLLSFSTRQGQDNIFSLAASTIDTTRADLLRSLQARATALDQGAQEHPRQIIISRVLSQLTDEQYKTFCEKQKSLSDEFEALGNQNMENQTARTFALTVILYPTFYFDDSRE